MTRALSAGLVTEVTARTLSPILLLELIYDSGPLRLWSGIGDLSWNGFTWTGTGTLLEMDRIEETAGLTAAGVNFRLSGVDSAIISLALAEPYQSRPAALYVGALDAAGAVVATPFKLFDGLQDVMAHRDEGGTAVVTLSLESRLIDLERPRERRYTPEDQHLEYPEDKGFQYVAALQDKEIVWRT